MTTSLRLAPTGRACVQAAVHATTRGRCLFVWEREEGVFGGQRRRRSKVARFWLDRRSEIIDLIQETELLSPIPIHSYIQVWEGGKNSLSVE